MINKLERRFGKYAIRGLMKYMMLLFGLGQIIFLMNRDFYDIWLAFDCEKVFLHGQIWRLVTWLIQPIIRDNIFITLLMMYVYYILGMSLEAKWGSFRFNLFYFGGIVFNLLSGILIYAVTALIIGNGMDIQLSLEYINLAMLLTFASEFGEERFLLFFVIPIKAKFFGIIVIIPYVYMLVKILVFEGVGVFLGFLVPFVIGILNFIIYWFVTRKERRARRRTFSDMRRRYAYGKRVNAGRREGEVVNIVNNRKVITKHRCAVCGRTELDDDMLEFRFCSKCEGNYEYCMDHLYTHTHVKREPAGTLSSEITNELRDSGESDNTMDSGDKKEV